MPQFTARFLNDLRDVSTPSPSSTELLEYATNDWQNQPNSAQANLDTHIADATIHYTEASIDHTNIQNVGTNAHSTIDSHIASLVNPHSTNLENLIDTGLIPTALNQVLTFGGTNWTNNKVLGQASGVCPLDASNLVPSQHIPPSLSLQGSWDANTNTPDLIASSPHVDQQYWVVNVAGNTQLGNITSWAEGDWALWSDQEPGNWIKVAGATGVVDFNTRQGNVVSVAGDYDTDLVNNVSTVTGASTSAALESLDGKIDNLSTTKVDNFGDTMTGDLNMQAPANIVLANASSLRATEVGATVRTILEMDLSDQVIVGNDVNGTVVNGSTVILSGDTVVDGTHTLTLAQDPATDLEAATKKYVDDAVSIDKLIGRWNFGTFTIPNPVTSGTFNSDDALIQNTTQIRIHSNALASGPHDDEFSKLATGDSLLFEGATTSGELTLTQPGSTPSASNWLFTGTMTSVGGTWSGQYDISSRQGIDQIGDVTGPDSSVDNELALFDGTTGKLIKGGSGVTSTNDGSILLGRDPAAALEASTMQYVDNAVNSIPLGQLTDVTETSPVVTNLVRYNGVEWVNSPLEDIPLPQNTNYNANAGEFIRIDTSLGNITVTLPASPNAGDTITIVKESLDANQIIIDGGVNLVETPFNAIVLDTNAILYDVGARSTWMWTGTSWIIKSSAKIAAIVELWSATPIIDVGTDQIINFTFQPLYAGQTPILATFSVGTFTLQFVSSLAVQISCKWDFVATGNNVDSIAEFRMSHSDPVGKAFLPSIAGSFATPRSGVFISSGSQVGTVVSIPNDTFQILGTAINSSPQMSVDLEEMFLILRAD